MRNTEINDKNMIILSAILREGFRFGDNQPKDINQVIFRLIDIANGEGYLRGEAESLQPKKELRDFHTTQRSYEKYSYL